MANKQVYLFVGAIFAILGLLSASGSVSLGTYQRQLPGGVASGSYLVYNPIFEALAVGLAGMGLYFVYQAGRQIVSKQSAK